LLRNSTVGWPRLIATRRRSQTSLLILVRSSLASTSFSGSCPFVLHLYAALAQKERALISARTKAALAAKKAAGFKLGNPRDMTQVAVAGREALRLEADRFAGEMLPLIESLRAAGMTTLRQISGELNRRGVRTQPRNSARRPEVTKRPDFTHKDKARTQAALRAAGAALSGRNPSRFSVAGRSALQT
jgi:DNA invertase Pin-like site-specific DNA recombinase